LRDIAGAALAWAHVTSRDVPGSERQAWADVVEQALRRAEAFSVIDHGEVVLRRLLLNSALSLRDPEHAAADTAARLFLAELPFTPAEAAALRYGASDDVRVLAALGAIKGWLQPVEPLLPHIQDPNLRAQVERWVGLRPQLP
jgi:hypothetical protein